MSGVNRSKAGQGNYSDPFAEIARDMRNLPEEARKAVRPALRKAGQMVAREAAVNSSWSGRIPGSIRVVTSFRQNREGVTVVAGNANAPHARPYEGIASRAATFRHPVFGHDVWVAQATRPFLIPAAESTEGSTTAFIFESMDEVAQSLGFS